MSAHSPRLLTAALRSCAAFAAALAAGCLAINALLPSLPVVEISTKLDHLREQRGQIDTVFLGSSRIYRSFDPQQFDQENAKQGLATRSFNLGVDGMRAPESFYILRELLKLRLPLRRLFIELGDVYPKVNAANFATARNVHWHDWRHTFLVLRHLAAAKRPAGERLHLALIHAGSFAVRASNIGRGQNLLGPRLQEPQKRFAFPVAWRGRAGFEPQNSPTLTGPARASYEHAIDVIERQGLAQVPIPPLLAETLRDLIREVRATGTQPIFVISPTIVGRENLVGLEEEGLDVPVIRFIDPRKHPGIFAPENHCDEQHLNAAGAREFTRALAAEFQRLPGD